MISKDIEGRWKKEREALQSSHRALLPVLDADS
jgi:hypothetical protein